MLIARAPVRISFAGGGTDFEGYYARFGGLVVSAAIDKYFYVFLAVNNRRDIQIMSSDYQTFHRQDAREEMLWDGDLALPRAILSHFDIHQGLSMFLASQVPPGTGLGSSSTVTVAVIKAVSNLLGLGLGKQEIAELACFIEIEKLGMPIGKQDQFAAAYGGVNAITFSATETVVEPLVLRPETLERLERELLLFYTGASREARRVLSGQNQAIREGDPAVLDALHAIKAMAVDARRFLETGNLPALGELLHHSWTQKKRLARGITNPHIDECYDLARACGAVGGKITGAGGGGFLMLYCGRHAARVTEALEGLGLKRMDYSVDFDGGKVLVNNAIPFEVAQHV